VLRAGELGARFVVVKAGEVRAFEPDWLRARERFLRGELDTDEAIARMAEREAAGERELDALRRALDSLARAAEGAGVTLCLRNGRRYIELPTARELDRLLGDLAGAPLAPLFDLAAAHLTDVMGFQPLELQLAAFGARAPLAYVGDACGPVGALAPGRGVLDVAAWIARLRKDAVLAFSPWSGLTVDEVVEAMGRV
jgi:hypothetical protein